jgi:malonyl-CoA/methylmalonyl-CoA synthetase
MPHPQWRPHLPPNDADAAGSKSIGARLLARRTLPAAWVKQWRAAPDAPAIFDGEGGWMTAGELEEASRRTANRLLTTGLRAGDRMLFSADSSRELVIAHVAALRAGIVVIPANTAYRAREVAHVVRDARPKAAFVDDAERGAWVRDAAGGAGRGEEIVVVGPEVAVPDAGDAGSDFEDPGPGSPAMIMYTSGTTGDPKGAVLSHGNLLCGTEALLVAWRWSGADRLVLALPLFHAHGLCVGLHGTLLAGASAVLLPRFTPAAVLDASRDHEATLFFGVPTMYHRLAQVDRASELGRLRLCVSGSAPLPAGLHARLAERTGRPVLERYGMTETLMIASNPYDGERRPGSVGMPLPGVEVMLSAHDSEILVRGPNVFSGYWQRPDATAAAFAEDWFRTGDVGTWDADGYLRILGRSKELIISGGYNVYPREVEDVLLAHPAVAEVAVVGTPSDEWGESVVAYIVPGAQAPSEAEVLRFAAERLAPYKRPRAVRFVGSLPRNAMGKVLKQELE